MSLGLLDFRFLTIWKYWVNFLSISNLIQLDQLTLFAYLQFSDFTHRCRSDVLGQLLPLFGKEYAHSGVTDLFTKIAANGYKFAYLSARAIGQAQVTRDYLKSVRQGKSVLPPGPMLLNPSSLINAFHKYVQYLTINLTQVGLCYVSVSILVTVANNPLR